MIATGQCACRTSAVLTEPRIRPGHRPLPRDPATTTSASLDRSTSVGMAADDKTSVWIWVGPPRPQAFSTTLTASSSSRRPCSFCHCAKPGGSGVFYHVVKLGETACTSVSETLRRSASRAAQSTATLAAGESSTPTTIPKCALREGMASPVGPWFPKGAPATVSAGGEAGQGHSSRAMWP